LKRGEGGVRERDKGAIFIFCVKEFGRKWGGESGAIEKRGAWERGLEEKQTRAREQKEKKGNETAGLRKCFPRRGGMVRKTRPRNVYKGTTVCSRANWAKS